MGLVYVFRANHLFLDSWGDWGWKTLERFQKNPVICQKCMGSVCHLTALNTNQQSSRRKDAEVTAKITIKLGGKVVYKRKPEASWIWPYFNNNETKPWIKKLSWKYRAISYQLTVCRLWLILWVAPNSLSPRSSTFFLLKVSAYRLHQASSFTVQMRESTWVKETFTLLLSGTES